MESMIYNDQHPAKRRKLDSATHDLNLEPLLASYIPLARISIPVRIPKLERRDRSGTQVDIREVTWAVGKTEIEVGAPWLKSNVTLEAGDKSSSRQVLIDCKELGSFSKIQRNPNKLLLGCYNAILDLDSAPATLHIEILWHDSSYARDRISSTSRDILYRYSSSQPVQSIPQAWDVQDFYENVHVPAPTSENNAELKVGLLHCDLYPFQRRAVRWLLKREGVSVAPSGQISASDCEDGVMLRQFRKAESANGSTYWVNDVLAIACSSHKEVAQRYHDIKGGLLAEAMGLGKTVEMIALMTLHPMKTSPLSLEQTALRRSGATLIITPPSILEQWKQEIQTHAPSLRVHHYQGLKNKKYNATIETLLEQDVVLTTYNVIAKELHYVIETPTRNLRQRPRPDPPKSPLDQILWWRVCLDEAQMIESGVSAAATVARLIPRVNAWAVTGTPIKQSHKDLFGLMLFLRYEPWCNSQRLWNELIVSHRALFRSLMSEMAIRHSKEIVREELRLPPQHRHTITISFSNIEQAHYSQMFYDMYNECGLDKNGAPLDEGWDPNNPKTTEKMRSWLTRLRQTCIHPEVGGRNRKALGRNNGPLRSVQQVLDVMIEQTESALRTEQRTMLISKIRQGQMHENAKNKIEAMRLYQEGYEASSKFVAECRKSLAEETLALKETEKKRETTNGDEYDTEEDDEDADDSQLQTARQQLRSALEVQHICIFFMGNIYFQTKSEIGQESPQSTEIAQLEKHETDAYEEAKKIRGELLKEVLRKANRKIAGLKLSGKDQAVTEIPKMELSEDDYAGIESRKIFDKLYDFCKAMNAQARQFEKLREVMVKYVQQALIDEDEGVELEGDEYEKSTKHQDEMYVYMELLRALCADRGDALSGLENLLIRGEMKQFLRMAKEGEGLAPELMIKLLAEREVTRINVEKQGSLRGIIGEIRSLVTSLEYQEISGRSRATAEMHIASQMLQNATKMMTTQTKTHASLEQEVGHLLTSMNARLEYYKALQKISDTVAPYGVEEDVGKPINQTVFQNFVRDEMAALNKCANHQARQRYLLHIKNESTSDSTPRICTICRDEFEIGAITSCGHVFCKEDIQLWFQAHGNCPVCKQRLRSADFFDVTYKPSEMTVQAENPPASPVKDLDAASHSDRVSASNTIYSDISTTQLNEIKNVDIRGASFGSKVDTICRQLHWLRQQDPGSKTIVFSQFNEVLDVLGRAFKQNGISYSRCDQNNGILDFKCNPSIECFLLHAKAHSAGLNLVVASHVILCEPLINTAIELQAIARVHRIGQQRATTVWMYLIGDTVEQSIYEISVKRRLDHLKSRDKTLSRSGTQTPVVLHESALDAANSKELQAADLSKALSKGRAGGEMVGDADLWNCLFGSVSKQSNTVLDIPDRSVDSLPANSVFGSFLRAEAAERRQAGL